MNQEPFNLDAAIADWRNRLSALGLRTPELLDELENHLREDIARRIISGADPRDAFEAAIQQIGDPSALGREFGKTNGPVQSFMQKLKRWIVARFIAGTPAVEHFTPDARLALGFAREEAPRLHHDFVGTEHVLLGLLRMEDGVVRKVLGRMGVNHAVVQSEIEILVGVGPENSGKAGAPYTPRATQALRLAGQEALALRHADVGSAHIFLGLVREGGGVAAVVLQRLGIQLETSRAAVLAELTRARSAN